jgi:hypothetical protein
MSRHLYTFLLLAALICPASVYGQQPVDSLVTGDFQNISFIQLADQLQALTGYRIFFDTSRVDSIRVSISADHLSLQAVLQEALSGKGLYVTVTANHEVFVSQGHPIRPALPPGFFDVNPDTSGLAAYNQGITTESHMPVSRVSPDNKLYDIGIATNHLKAGNSNLAGYVHDGQTGEAIAGAILYIEHPHISATTDRFGYYSITVPRGIHILYILGPGMFDATRRIMLYSEGKMNIDLQEKVLALKTVIIESSRAGNIKNTTMGMQRISMASIKQMPAAFGETDILRAVLTMPGVQSVGEASTGFNVRGGATDQNLILFNDLTIYNPAHFFGFFSAFDPDLVRDITLYTSSIPAQYGGRLSSVLDITSREGNTKKISGTAGIGLLTSKLTIDGPIDKKTTFIAGVRTTYSDWLLNLLPAQYRKSTASFYDATLHISHHFDDKNDLYLNGYISHDSFNLNGDTTYSYGNRNANIRYKHQFSNTFYGVATFGYDEYNYAVQSTMDSSLGYRLNFGIRQYDGKLDFNYYLGSHHSLEFGLDNKLYKIQSGSFGPQGKYSLVLPQTLQPEQALESALYISDQYTVTDNLSIDYGIRYSLYNYLGPREVYIYPPSGPKIAGGFTDSVNYGSGKVIKTYQGPEFRISGKYSLSPNTSLKLSYNTLRQYIAMLSNTTAAFPTDIWKLSDSYIPPELGHQVSLGLYHNLKSNTIETSLEVYYKWIDHTLDFKSGSVLLMNPQIETAVINMVGKDYGAELLIRKVTGKLNGWISYAYSRSLIKQDDPTAGELINQGNYYPSNYDKPNALNITSNYRFSHRFSLSVDMTYSTGRPITLPIGQYYYGGSSRALYSDRNEYRIPDYFRMDFSMNIEGNHRIKQFSHNSWTIGVYNMTGRKNAYSVYFISENGAVNGYQLSVFGTAIPYITYNIRF